MDVKEGLWLEPINKSYSWSIIVMLGYFDLEKALKSLYSKLKRVICEALPDNGILEGKGNIIWNEI